MYHSSSKSRIHDHYKLATMHIACNIQFSADQCQESKLVAPVASREPAPQSYVEVVNRSFDRSLHTHPSSQNPSSHQVQRHAERSVHMASDIKLSTQDDLDVVWLQVVSEFEKETGSILLPANGAALSVGDVIAGIDPHKHVPVGTKNKAIRITKSILSCVQVFGGFVASAASGVFGPSQQCFSALNHVITTTQKYSEVFEDLTTFLERMSVFLETLSNYLDEGDDEVKLDKRLRPNVYRVLEHFLVILTLTTRLAKRRGKVRLFAKVFFTGDDEGVTAALTTLETRVVDVTRVQITTIGKDLSDAARSIRSMQGDIDAILKYDEENSIVLKSLAETESSRASAEAIRTWLNLEDTRSWRHQHARLTEKCVRGTGSWLFANDSFAQWKDPNSTETKVILITGKANRGKSCLTSAVIDHLRESTEKTESPVHLLAYHYLQNITHHQSSINIALRSIVWQLGQLDRGYQAFLSKACADGVGLQDAFSVWRKLLAGYTPSNITTFFVVLDGLDKSVMETLRIIVGEAARQCEGSTPGHLRIRLFLSGSPEAISLLERATAIYKFTLDPGFDKDQMVANIDDVQELIRKRLASMPIFRQEATPFKNEQQQQTMHTLTVHIQNDFAALDLVFEELERCTNLGQLKETLERVDEDMHVKIGRHIDSLNQSLSKHEILELNAIMACVATHWDLIDKDPENHLLHFPRIELVQEYVDFTLKTTRLVPLEKQIEKMYHSIFMVAGGWVIWRHEGLLGYLEERSADERTMRAILAKRAKRSDLLNIEQLNLLEKVVQTNLTHVFGAYGTELFEKYGFTEFFASKREPYRICISLDQRESEFSTLLICLQIICEDPDVHPCRELRSHALDTVYERLASALYLKPTKQEKIVVGRCLAKILRCDDVIDAYARDGRGRIGPGVLRVFEEDHFDKWLIDLEPDDLEDREEKEWFRTWKHGTGSHWDYVSKRFVRRWLKMGNEEWSAASMFIEGYTMRHKHSWLCSNFADDGPETLQQITKLMFEECADKFTFGDIRRAFYRDDDEVWMTHECDRIFKVSDKTWWAPFFAAKRLAESVLWESPKIEQVQKVFDYLNTAISLELFEDEAYTRRYWHEMLLLFAKCQVYLRDLAGAKKTYIRMMSSPESREQLDFRLFSSLEPRMVMEISMIAQSVLVEPSGHNLFQQMMSGDLTAEHLLPLRLAANSDCDWQYFVDLIEHSTLTGPSSQMLRSTVAYVLWHKSGDTQRENRALDIWKEERETQAVVDALLGRARKEVPNNPLESYSFQRLKRMHPEISDPTDDPNISFRAKVIVAGWKHQAGQVIEAREFISALLGHRHYLYPLTDTTEQRVSMLADWGLACIACGNEDLGILLLEQISLMTWRKAAHMDHLGCRKLCKSETDDTGQSNDRPILLCCKTCLAVIKPECRATVERGVRLPDLCEVDHQYLSIRKLSTCHGEKEENYGVQVYKDEYTDQYNTWSPENNGIDRARELYGWALPELIDKVALEKERAQDLAEYAQALYDSGYCLGPY